MDREKVIKGLCDAIGIIHGHVPKRYWGYGEQACRDAITMLKEQEKKQINLHKKHIITWKRDDEFTMRKLYEAVCETLMDEGELVIVRMDDHEKVDFTFYVTQGDT